MSSRHSTVSPPVARSSLRIAVLAVAGLELALVVWLVLRSDMPRRDWSQPSALDDLWIPGLFGALSGAALPLAGLGRGLGWAITLCVLYALLAALCLSLAQVAIVAG